MKRLFLVLILVPCLLAAACTGVTLKKLGELQTLQAELTNKFGDEISLNLANDGMLSIAFINSRLNDKPAPERAKRAEESAQIVNAHYAGSTVVTAIYVIFLRRKTQFVVFHQTQPVDDYGFERQGQELRRASPYWPAPLPDREITVGHSSNGTDISASTTFQIDGEPGGYGLTVLPHFRLQSEARGIKAPPPPEVSFLFASYSRKPRFGGAVPVEFIVDGIPVTQEQAMFTGNDAQYCTVDISYSAFRKLISAKAVSIKLGAREYPLTPKQLETLQKMDAYVL